LRPFGPPPHRRPRSPRRAFGIGAALAFVLLTCTGCDTTHLPNLAFPNPATKESPQIMLMWEGSWLAALIVGGVVWGLILWACVFHRKKSEDHIPIQSRYNLPIEVLYTVIPFIIVAVLFFFTARDESNILDLKKKPDETVNVVGRQWSWTFNYVTDQAYDVGTPAQLPQLWLPVNETVRFVLTSPDVIHSFWIPAFLFKMDVFPGKENTFQLTPNKIGVYEGKCAELCGTYHSRMLFSVHVVSQADYQAHEAALRAAGQTGNLWQGVVNSAADRERAYTLGDPSIPPPPEERTK
jgi:cytochrome c oxidase subunit 2